jgi:hypothetical protein
MRARPRLLLISMALAEQVADVTRIAQSIAELPVDVRPRVIVGGNAVKRGHVDAIPHAELLADISLLGAAVLGSTRGPSGLNVT